jgi:hypothetical protein
MGTIPYGIPTTSPSPLPSKFLIPIPIYMTWDRISLNPPPNGEWGPLGSPSP